MPHTPLVQLVLAFVNVHPPQVLPLAPQLVADWLPNASQVFPLQQPVQDVESQTHWPVVLQRCPGEHDPQTPGVPHVPGPWLAYGTQAFPLQHPLAQEAAVHVQVPAELHTCPPAHVTQAAPPVPHVELPRVWQWPFESQQPEGHEFASHTQLPCAPHSCFAAHMAHVPPPRPHAVVDGVVLHTPLAQHPLHDVPPQLQAPPPQAWPDAHVPHALPADPQALGDWLAGRTQVAPWQQPPGHEEGVQVQVPALPQAWSAAHDPHAAPPAPHCVADWLA
jgi:hypothetical protein